MAVHLGVALLGRAGFTYACSKNLHTKALVYNGVDMVVCALASRWFLDRYQNGSEAPKLAPLGFTLGLGATRFLGMAAGIAATSFLCHHRMSLGKAMIINFGAGILMNLTLAKELYQTGSVKFPTLV